MIKLKTHNTECAIWNPPIPVEKHFGPVDITADQETQIKQLSWIPALLVCRFLGQFPHLWPEADEMFSIAMLKVVETVASNDGEFDGDKIGSVCNVRGRRAIEDHANGVYSAIKICTTTRYENRKKGIQTPVSGGVSEWISHEDDHTELIVKDAANALGFDLENMTRSERKALAEALK